MKDLFGEAPEAQPTTPRRGPKGGKRYTAPAGYAALPGTGPVGEACRTCKHLYRNRMAKTYLKCDLMRLHWTGGAKTDVQARSPACKLWEAAGV